MPTQQNDRPQGGQPGQQKQGGGQPDQSRPKQGGEQRRDDQQPNQRPGQNR